MYIRSDIRIKFWILSSINIAIRDKIICILIYLSRCRLYLNILLNKFQVSQFESGWYWTNENKTFYNKLKKRKRKESYPLDFNTFKQSLNESERQFCQYSLNYSSIT